MRRLISFAVGIAILFGLAIFQQPANAQVFGDFDSLKIVTAPYQELSNATPVPAATFGLPPTWQTDPDDGYARVPIGFTFEFNGTLYDQVYICVNGFITFTEPPLVPANVPTALFQSSPSYPVNVIAPFWGNHYYRLDADKFSGYLPSSISYKTDVVGGQHIFTVQWKNLNINDPTLPSSVGNFQVKLYESTNPITRAGNIEFAYGQIGGNPNTQLTTVITRNASVGIKGEAADFINALTYNQPPSAWRTSQQLTNEWTPSGGTDKRIRFVAGITLNVDDFWGDGDADMSKAPGRKHEGMPQNRFVTVNDARVIMHSISTGTPLDSVRRRAAFHGDVNHNGRYYYDNNGNRQDIPWRNSYYGDSLPTDVNTIKRIFYQVTEYDAVMILQYISARLPELPWLLDTVVQHGKVNIPLVPANGVRLGNVVALGNDMYNIPVYANGFIQDKFAVKFNADAKIVDVTTQNTDNVKFMSDFSNNTVVLAATGNIDETTPLCVLTVAAGSPELKLSQVRFNDEKSSDAAVILASVSNDEEASTLMQNTPNPVLNSTMITVNPAVAGNYNLSIYDALGNRVKTLVNSYLDARPYNFNWNGIDENGNVVSNGVYIYKLNGENVTITKKMVVTK